MKKNLFSILKSSSFIVSTAALTIFSSCKKSNDYNEVADVNTSVSNTKLANITLQAGQVAPPSAVSHLYNTYLDPSVSDDFNGDSVDFTKWQYRTNGSRNI